MVKVKLMKSSEIITPKYAHEDDACMDVYSNEDVVIEPFGRVAVSTGLYFIIPLGYCIQVRPKSGLALNEGITVLNAPGVIDSGYRGELKCILFNANKLSYRVKKGQKIAQIALEKVERIEFEFVDSLSETLRGSKGFGSTGLD